MRETLWRSRISTLVAVLVIMFGFPKLPQASNWWENIKIEGDFRYRHEMIDKEGKDIRHRHRLRARLSVFAKANDMIDIGIRMATGSNDPVSTNQTLDNAFSTKDFRLDMAYFNLYHEKVPDFRTTAGKFKNPFFKPGKSELIWDSDWNPEGGAATFHHDLNNVAVTLIGAGLWIEEHSSSDAYISMRKIRVLPLAQDISTMSTPKAMPPSLTLKIRWATRLWKQRKTATLCYAMPTSLSFWSSLWRQHTNSTTFRSRSWATSLQILQLTVLRPAGWSVCVSEKQRSRVHGSFAIPIGRLRKMPLWAFLQTLISGAAGLTLKAMKSGELINLPKTPLLKSRTF
jgi:hypothetical protein